MQVPEEDQQWLHLLRPSRPDILDKAVVGPEVVAEVAGLIGRDATGWAIERARELQGIIEQRLTLTPGIGSESGGPRTETFVLWALTVASAERYPSTAFLTTIVDDVIHWMPSGLSLEMALRGLQFSHSFVATALFDLCQQHVAPESQAHAVRQISTNLMAGIETLYGKLGLRYAVERERWLVTAAAIRHQTVLSLLEGSSVDMATASANLTYDVSLNHVALVLWSPGSAVTDERDLEAAARRVLGAAGCTSLLFMPAGAGRLWAWGGNVRQAPVIGVIGAESVHIAAGLPGHGPEGFRSSHFQAIETERCVAQMSHGDAGLHTFHEIELFGLLSAKPSDLEAFVARELGALAANDGATAALRATLKSYLDNERSLAASAAQLHIAKNTVLYRVRKAEQLLGRPLNQDRLRLSVALFVKHHYSGVAD